MTIRHRDPIHSSLKHEIPNSAVYDLPPYSVAQKTTSEVYPINGGSSSTFSDTSNRVAQFFLPASDQLLDPKSVYLQCTASASGTNAYLDLVNSSPLKLFERVRIYTSGGTELEDINGYSNLSQVLHTDFLPNDAIGGALNACGGFFSSTAEASSQSTSTSGSTIITVPLNTGLFQQNKMIPLEATDGLYIELTMAPAAQVVRTSAGTGSYGLTNMRLTYDTVRLDEKVHQEMREYWRTKGLKLYLSTWQHHPRVVQSGQTRDAISITDRSRSARAVIATMRPSANQNSHTADGFVRTRNNLQSYQLKVGSGYIPSQAIRYLNDVHCGSAWKRVEQAFPMVRGCNIKNSDFVNNKFLIAESLEAVQEHISGSQHSDELQPIELLLDFASATAQAQVDIYIQTDCVIEMTPGGVRKYD